MTMPGSIAFFLALSAQPRPMPMWNTAGCPLGKISTQRLESRASRIDAGVHSRLADSLDHVDLSPPSQCTHRPRVRARSNTFAISRSMSRLISGISSGRRFSSRASMAAIVVTLARPDQY